MTGTPLPLAFPPEPKPQEIAAWRAEIGAAQGSPWLATLMMRRLAGMAERLAALRAWLAALPRRTRRGWARRSAHGLPLAALVLALSAGDARAATITVGVGGCTLEDAITAANTDTATGGCPAGSGPDTIQFDVANGSHAIFSSYGGPLPVVNSDVTIQGNGNTTLNGEGSVRVLQVVASGDLTLSDLTITGGSASYGGGIRATAASLTATNVVIQGNFAYEDGGGLYTEHSTVTLTDCTISGNSADDDGGGAVFSDDSTVFIRSSTISGNTSGDVGGGLDPDYSVVYIYESAISGNSAADDGGGIDADGSRLYIVDSSITGNITGEDGGGIDSYRSSTFLTNVTLSGNSAAYNGGGLFSYAEVAEDSFVAIQFSTITGNSAGVAGGGIFTPSTYAFARNNIIAHQVAGADCAGGTPYSDGYNIESGTSCDFTSTGDLQNVSGAALDLQPLALNAPGTTPTHALGVGSVALNRIPENTNGCGADVSRDQRSVARPQLGACDVGAYELEDTSPPPPPTAATLVRFGAAADPTGRVVLAWDTASEVDVVGFRVERAALGASRDPFRRDGAWTAVGDLVPARGGAAVGAAYTLADTVAPGAYAYRLVVVNPSEPPSYHGPVTARVDAIRAFLPWAGQR